MSKYKFACSHIHFVLSCRLYIYFVSHGCFWILLSSLREKLFLTWIMLVGHLSYLYLEADVRSNGRNEAGREVTLPLFWEEGLQLSHLEGTRTPFSGILCNTNLWPKFRVTCQFHRTMISQGYKPKSSSGNFFARSFLLCFSLISSRLNSALRIEGSGGLAN